MAAEGGSEIEEADAGPVAQHEVVEGRFLVQKRPALMCQARQRRLRRAKVSAVKEQRARP